MGHSALEITPGLEEYWINLFGRVAAGGEPANFEHYTGPLNRYYAGTAYSPHPNQVAVTFMDVTERRRAEEALPESELRYRQLFERSESGVALHETVFDAQGNLTGYRCLDINPACERIMGLSRSQVLGRCAHEVFPELGEFCIKLFGRVAATQEPVAFENYSRTMGRHFAGSAYSPRPNQFAVSFMDVTERKRAEEEVRRLNVELEERVRSRTAALGSGQPGTGSLCPFRFARLACSPPGHRRLEPGAAGRLRRAPRRARTTNTLIAFAPKRSAWEG